MKAAESDGEVAAEVDDMRKEYDFSGGVRGKYAAQFQQGTNIVLLDPDVKEVFPDSAAVNAALRMVIRAGAHAARVRARAKRAGSQAASPDAEEKRAS